MTVTHFTCPHCGCMASTDEEVYALDFGGGCPPSFFFVKDLAKGRERHIDMRVCCQDCFKLAGEVPAQLGHVHPYSGSAHDERLARACGVHIGAPPR